MMQRFVVFFGAVLGVQVLIPSCQLFYTECEPVLPDTTFNAAIGDREEEIHGWYDLSVDSSTVHLLRPLHSIDYSNYPKLLASIGIHKGDLGAAEHDRIVAVTYFLEDTSKIHQLGDPQSLQALLVYFVHEDTLHTRFFKLQSDRLHLLEAINASPRYLSGNNTFSSLRLFDPGDNGYCILELGDPSEANAARGGRTGDYIDEVDAYLESLEDNLRSGAE